MAKRHGWVLALGMVSLLGSGCVSSHGTPLAEDSSSPGFQNSYFSPPTPPPMITSNTTFGPKESQGFSGTLKSTTSRIASSFHKMGDALALHPKVEGAKDPLSLNSPSKPLGPDMYLAAARMLEAKGDLEQATLQMKKALELDPDNRDTLIRFARMKHRMGALDEARQQYERIVQLFPEDPVAHNDLGLCLARQGRLDEALTVLARAVDLRPASKLYRNNIATVLLESGRTDEALQQLAQVFEPSQAYHNLGYLLYQRGDKENAEKYLAQAEQLGSRTIAQVSNNTLAPEANVPSVQGARTTALPRPRYANATSLPSAAEQPATTYSTGVDRVVKQAESPVLTGSRPWPTVSTKSTWR